MLPLGSIEGIYKDLDGKALILINDTQYCPVFTCADKLRFIQTGINYANVVAMFDGDIENIGNINLIYQDRLPKR